MPLHSNIDTEHAMALPLLKRLQRSQLSIKSARLVKTFLTLIIAPLFGKISDNGRPTHSPPTGNKKRFLKILKRRAAPQGARPRKMRFFCAGWMARAGKRKSEKIKYDDERSASGANYGRLFASLAQTTKPTPANIAKME